MTATGDFFLEIGLNSSQYAIHSLSVLPLLHLFVYELTFGYDSFIEMENCLNSHSFLCYEHYIGKLIIYPVPQPLPFVILLCSSVDCFCFYSWCTYNWTSLCRTWTKQLIIKHCTTLFQALETSFLAR